MNSLPLHSNSAASTASSQATDNSWQNRGMVDEDDDDDRQLFFVTSYSDFDKLAHGPKGSQASKPIYIYSFSPSDGSLVLLNIQGSAETVVNPAFSRYHPKFNVVYTCTEDCEENGKIFAYRIGPDGSLDQLGECVDAGGTSTCYLTIDKCQKNLLAVNYWNSTLAVIPLDPETGAFAGPVKSLYDPKGGKGMVASVKTSGGVNHSNNDDSTIRMRQADPHSHALVLDPFVGRIAYVPDLGKDLIREFYYDPHGGKIELEMNVIPSGLCSGMPDGPRYFVFHPRFNIAYVVNELSSTIAVFEVNRDLLNEVYHASKNGQDMAAFKGRSTLRLVQSISTIPSAFPKTLNTCGRICTHQSGRYVVVSNRGHQSITVFRVKMKGPKCGELTTVGHFHTRGETPRHFQFDNSGQYLLVANQDTDSIAVFNFNLSNGELKYSGNEYRVPSPNFVCCCPSHRADPFDEVLSTMEKELVQTGLSSFAQASSYAVSVTGSDSDDSTLPVARRKKENNNALREELANARREIEELKKLLAEKV